MAIYEGARPASLLLPRVGRRAITAPPSRRRLRGAIRARRRTSWLSTLLGGIVVAFMLAFFSLAQSVRVSATGYEVEALMTQRQELVVRKQELLSDIHRLGREPAIRKLSIDAGLGQLPEPVVLPGR